VIAAYFLGFHLADEKFHSNFQIQHDSSWASGREDVLGPHFTGFSATDLSSGYAAQHD